MKTFLGIALLSFWALSIRPSSSEVIQYKFKSLFRTQEFGYAAFIHHPNSKLDVENTVRSSAQYPKQCALGCARNVTCQSFNFGTQPIFVHHGKPQYICELLPTDKYRSSSKFQNVNTYFNHYSIRVSLSFLRNNNNIIIIYNLYSAYPGLL
jgi:hypothetical protein